MDYDLMDSYEWDEAKRRENLAKHSVDFYEISRFEWGNAVYNPNITHGELRWVATAYIGDRLHTVVYTERERRYCIISLRRASKREERDYAVAQTGPHQPDR